jgi:hypothetical protein
MPDNCFLRLEASVLPATSPPASLMVGLVLALRAFSHTSMPLVGRGIQVVKRLSTIFCNTCEVFAESSMFTCVRMRITYIHMCTLHAQIFTAPGAG